MVVNFLLSPFPLPCQLTVHFFSRLSSFYHCCELVFVSICRLNINNKQTTTTIFLNFLNYWYFELFFQTFKIHSDFLLSLYIGQEIRKCFFFVLCFILKQRVDPFIRFPVQIPEFHTLTSQQSSRLQSLCSRAPWLRKCGNKLPILETQ